MSKLKNGTMKTIWNPGGKSIVYLHLSHNGRSSIYFRVNTLKEDVTVISLKRDPKKGKPFCFGIYKMRFTTFICNYGRYAAYWGTHDTTVDGEIIGHFMKITTRNQWIRAFLKVFETLKIPAELYDEAKAAYFLKEQKKIIRRADELLPIKPLKTALKGCAKIA